LLLLVWHLVSKTQQSPEVTWMKSGKLAGKTVKPKAKVVVVIVVVVAAAAAAAEQY